MDIKYFKSIYGKKELNKEWSALIKALGVNVYDVIVPCERAVVLGGFWENPSVFKDIDAYVFYLKETGSSLRAYMHGTYVDILRLYYGEDRLFNLTGLKVEKAAKYIKETVEAD